MAESSERPGLFRRLLKGSSEQEKVRTARFPLQAYGKLPIYKDFISIGLTDPGAREFRQWLDRGFSYRWAENEQYRDTEIPPHGFLLRLPESRSCVAGVLWGSSDEGGLRRFPFTVFVSFPAAQPAADPLAALHYLAAIERRCDEVRDGYAAGAVLSDFYKAYRGAEFECALKTREQAGKELKSAIADFPVSEFAESLFGARAATRWPAFLAALGEAAGQANGPGAIRLPISGLLPRSREIALWLRWLERLDAKPRRPVTGVLYTGGRGPGRAVLFSRDLAPEDFLLLHPTHRGDAQVLEVGGSEETPPVAEASSPAEASPDRSEGEPATPVAAAAPETAPVPPAALPETPAAGEIPIEPAEAEPLPFPEAQSPEIVSALGPRETFSALIVPVADPPAAAVPPPPPEPVLASPAAGEPEPGPPPGEPEAPPPADWSRPLYALLGL
jgi:type VI secretion system ImpM family protein